MLVQPWKNLLNKLKLFFAHSFHNEAAIMTEEEEATTSTGGLTSLKNLIAVGAGVKGPLDLLEVYVVHATHSLKDTRREGRDLGPRQ